MLSAGNRGAALAGHDSLGPKFPRPSSADGRSPSWTSDPGARAGSPPLAGAIVAMPLQRQIDDPSKVRGKRWIGHAPRETRPLLLCLAFRFGPSCLPVVDELLPEASRLRRWVPSLTSLPKCVRRMYNTFTHRRGPRRVSSAVGRSCHFGSRLSRRDGTLQRGLGQGTDR
jgi:hypothetical protein